MAKNKEILKNGCIRFTKTMTINGIPTKVTIEKDTPEQESNNRRYLETKKLQRNGFSGIKKRSNSAGLGYNIMNTNKSASA